MVSCGYEPTAVIDGFGSLKGFWSMVRGSFSKYPDRHALNLLNEPMPHGPSSLVQITHPDRELEGDTRMTAEVLKYTLEQVEALELAPGTEHLQLEGWVPELAGEDELRKALEKAFDYRGDVTHHAQDRREDRSLHLQPLDRRYAGRLVGAVLHAQG